MVKMDPLSSIDNNQSHTITMVNVSFTCNRPAERPFLERLFEKNFKFDCSIADRFDVWEPPEDWEPFDPLEPWENLNIY